jgi:plastocyanin
MRRRRFLTAGGIALGGGVAGCSGDGGGRTVTMADLAFDPERLSIPTGATVTWGNESDVEHTVTAYADEVPARAAYFASGGFESERAARANVEQGLLAPGERYGHTFETPGEFRYYCIPHEGSEMVGTIAVGGR